MHFWRHPHIFITLLAGCDKLTIAPNLLASLAADEGQLIQKLTTQPVTSVEASLTQGQFLLAMAQNPMANEKLAQGISAFIADQQKLAALLAG